MRDGISTARAYTSAANGVAAASARRFGGRRADAPPITRSGDDLYRALLELSAEAIARFEVVPALPADLAADAQVERLLRDARIVECNEAFARLYGRRVEETIGHVFSDLVPAESRRGPLADFVRAGHRLVDSEVARRLEDGSVRWSSVSALGVVEEGRLQGYWVALHDITARKRAEAERERRDEILEAVAFGAARLLAPGAWESKAADVIGGRGGGVRPARARGARDPGVRAGDAGAAHARLHPRRHQPARARRARHGPGRALRPAARIGDEPLLRGDRRGHGRRRARGDGPDGRRRASGDGALSVRHRDPTVVRHARRHPVPPGAGTCGQALPAPARHRAPLRRRRGPGGGDGGGGPARRGSGRPACAVGTGTGSGEAAGVRRG